MFLEVMWSEGDPSSGNGNDRNGSENGKGIGSGFQEYEDAEGNVFRA